MKTLRNFLYIAAAVAVAACEPMEDIYEENGIDDGTLLIANGTYTLSPSDYGKMEGAPDYVKSGEYFASQEEAASFIPGFLKDKYIGLKEKSALTVTYNRLVFDFSAENEVTSVITYEATSADYNEITGNTYGNFDNMEDVFTLLNQKFIEADSEEPNNYKLVLLSYKLYANGTAKDRTEAFYYVDGMWQTNTYLVSDEDYEATGNGQYKNFTGADDDKLVGYFNSFLENVVTLQPKTGDVMQVVYYYYSGSASYHIMALLYDGSAWQEVTETITTADSIRFNKRDGEWKPDISTPYTLTAADYQWVADNSAAGTESARSNLRNYGNFSASAWPLADRREAFSQLLSNKFPNAEAGTRYLLTYMLYSGGTNPANITMEKKESGAWVDPDAEE